MTGNCNRFSDTCNLRHEQRKRLSKWKEATCTVKTVNLWMGMDCHHNVLPLLYHSCINRKINKSNGKRDVCVHKLNGYFLQFGLSERKRGRVDMNVKVLSRCCLLLLCSSCIVFHLAEFDNSMIFEKAGVQLPS